MKNNYRVLVSVWKEGENVAEHFKFRTEIYDDLDELFDQQKEFTNLTILEREETEDDDETNEPN